MLQRCAWWYCKREKELVVKIEYGQLWSISTTHHMLRRWIILSSRCWLVSAGMISSWHQRLNMVTVHYVASIDINKLRYVVAKKTEVLLKVLAMTMCSWQQRATREITASIRSCIICISFHLSPISCFFEVNSRKLRRILSWRYPLAIDGNYAYSCHLGRSRI